MDATSVVAVRRLPDVVQSLPVDSPGMTPQKITMTCFELRMIDGKAINFQTPSRTEAVKFLHEIGVDWKVQ